MVDRGNSVSVLVPHPTLTTLWTQDLHQMRPFPEVLNIKSTTLLSVPVLSLQKKCIVWGRRIMREMSEVFQG